MEFGGSGKFLGKEAIINIRSSAVVMDRSTNLRASAIRYSQVDS